MSDPKDMTDEQLNEAVAVEVMGWKHRKDAWGWTTGKPVVGFYDVCDRAYYEWHPSINHNHAFEVLARIAELGLQHEFMWCLGAGNHDSFNWYLLTCPPRDICSAALQAVRAQKGEGT